MRNFIRNYPLSIILVVFIWIICLIPIPETPLDNVRLIDKWTHIVMYLVLSSVVGHERFRANKRENRKTTPRQLVAGEWLLPVLMGGLIEIVQATCTGGTRSGDWFDWLADAIGATIGLFFGLLILKVRK